MIGASVVDVVLKSRNFKVVKSHQIETGLGLCEVLGGKIDADEGVVATGGGGSNVAVGLRRLGQSVKIVSKIGNDSFGELVKKDFESEMVDCASVVTGVGQTGFSSVLVSDEGSRSIMTLRGLSGEIVDSDIDWKMVERADWVQISSLGGNVDLLSDIVTYCFEKGVKVGVNPGKAELEDNRVKSVLNKVDYLNLNRQEAAGLVGVDFGNEKEIATLIAKVGSKVVTVTDGARGSSMIVNHRWLKTRSIKTRPADDTGAGDGFVSGVVFGYLTNRSHEECLSLGNINGSSVVSFLGAKFGLLRQGEIEKKVNRKMTTTEEVV